MDMNLQFNDGWDKPANNEPVYNGGRRLSGREVFVIVDKIMRSNIWADEDEITKVKAFIDNLKNDVRIDVLKGAHGDRYRRMYGLHLTVVTSSGCWAGETFHLYGKLRSNGAWEVDFISTYNPRIRYCQSREKLVHYAVEPAPQIVVIHGCLPLTRYEKESGCPVIRERL